MSQDIWVVAEIENGAPTLLALELTYGARIAADRMGLHVRIAVLGNGLGSVSGELIKAGADQVCLIDDPALASFAVEPWLRVLGDLFAARSPEFVLLGATPIGEELAPRLAHRFGSGLISRCMSLQVDDTHRTFVGLRAVYGGAYDEVVVTSGPAPQLATALSGCFDPPRLDASRVGETETVSLKIRDDGLGSDAARGRRLSPPEVVDFQMPRPKLKNARRIVSVGRQVGDIKQAKWLATILGAEFAGAREAVDEGYIDESQVVGITGTRVSPDLYVALGIRGDTMHAFGIQDARFIVAVHPDPDAPIFKQADVGIVGDPAKVAGELVQRLGGD